MFYMNNETIHEKLEFKQTGPKYFFQAFVEAINILQQLFILIILVYEIHTFVQ